jgi:beta-lactamase regulating signal transducer with metallopeptidase domain
MNLHAHSLVSAVAMALIHSLWQAALIALAAALGFGALRRAGAAWRHVLGMACLLAMVALPMLTFIQACQSPTPVGATVLPQLIPPLQSAGGAAPTPWRDWGAAAVTLLWLVGVAVMLVLRVGGWQWVRGMDRQPWEQLPPAWQVRLGALRQALAISREVSVRLGRGVAAPFTAWLLRPVIYLPLDLLARLPRDQIEALLAHELAHIRRLDWVWNLAQSAVEAVLFYHPAMWWLSGRIRQERELACDAMAAAACGSPLPLAEALAGLERGRGRMAPRGLALGAGGGALTRRVRHLLSGRAELRNGRAMGALLLLCGLCLVPAAAMRAPLHLLINVHMVESTHGSLGPGGVREISARYLFDKPRYYRASVDQAGAVREIFREGGAEQPINAEVRKWVGEMVAMHEPSEGTRGETMAGLLAAIKNDARVTSVTGTPAVVVDGTVSGGLEVSALPGVRLQGIGQVFGSHAKVGMVLAGPNGRARVAYQGEGSGADWRPTAVTVVPLPR